MLAGVAGTKIVVALSRGRTNILFLVIEAIVFCVLAYKVTHPFRTPAGDALLDELGTLFAGLRARAGSLALGAADQDVALLAAVFGIGALPSAFPATGCSGRHRHSGSSCGAACGFWSGGADDRRRRSGGIVVRRRQRRMRGRWGGCGGCGS